MQDFGRRFSADKELIHCDYCFECAKLNIQDVKHTSGISLQHIQKEMPSEKDLHSLENEVILHISKEYTLKYIFYSMLLKNEYDILK